MTTARPGGYEGRKGKNMKFKWMTADGIWREKTITNYEERLKFIEWLETDPSVVTWR